MMDCKTVLDRVSQIASSLRRKQHESPVFVAILNNYLCHDALGILATLSVRGTAIPMSIRYGEMVCRQIIENTSPGILLTDMDRLPTGVKEAAERCGARIVHINQRVCFTDHFHLQQLSAKKAAMIMHTSGSTGLPKGVMLSDRNILANLASIAGYFQLKQNDRFLISRPLYHAAVMTGEFLTALYCGCEIRFCDGEFSPAKMLRMIEIEHCTILCTTPTIASRLAARTSGPTGLKKLVVSGECLHRQVAIKLSECFAGTDLMNVYGLTEASPRVAHLSADLFLEKAGSVGVPLSGVKVKIVTPPDTSVVPGEIGELCVQGPNVMDGYWRDPESTKISIRDGWLYTGDLAYFDDDGFIYITGRKDHMIIRGGLNIYPQMIENVILECEKVDQAVVWGEPDDHYGQRICLAVVPVKGAELTKSDIITAYRDKLPNYLWPEMISIVKSIPKSASGKLQRSPAGY